MTSITLHGEIGEIIGRSTWKLEVLSIAEALRAIQVLSKGKLFNYLMDASKKNLEYKVLVNERELLFEKEISTNDPDSIFSSELVMNNKNLKSLDIVPIIVGAGGGGGGGAGSKGIVALVLGVLLIATGVGAFGGAGLTLGSGLGAGLAIAGLTLAVTGITLLMMQPPKFEDFRKIEDGKSSVKPSYLFDGPTNIIGPVPIGYGRMLIGSQTIEVSIDNKELPNFATADDIKNNL
jgi:predicted phage tail protein